MAALLEKNGNLVDFGVFVGGPRLRVIEEGGEPLSRRRE
jgi:hypothetical protein